MTTKELTEILRGSPTLEFGCSQREDGTLALVVEACSGTWRQLLRREDDIAGLGVRDIFVLDPLLVDDWMEFVLNMRTDPKMRLYDARDGDVVSHRTLQFMQSTKGWAAVDLDYNMKTGHTRVAFSPPRDAVTKVGVQQLMGLRQSLWLQNFVESGGKWEIDLEQNAILLSRNMARAMQYGDDAMVVPLERFLASVHPDDLTAVKKGIENVDETRVSVYNRGVMEDGSVRHFSSFGIPGYAPDGKLIRVIGQSQNITDKQMAIEMLSMSEQRFRGIVENSPDLFVVCDQKGIITYVSPNVTAIGGYPADKVVGLKFDRFFPFKDEVVQLKSAFARVLERREQACGDYLVQHADGSTRWFTIRMNGIVGTNGKVAEVVAVCRDVSEEKKQAENLRYMSTHDALTGVFNRYYFEEALQRIQDEEQVRVGLVMTDLNGLKLVNDAFGLRRGDELLQEAAVLLERVCDDDCQLFRVGGDEFAILMEECREEDVSVLCRHIAEACRATLGNPIPVNLSVGSVWREDTGIDVDQMSNRAESDMYSNKLLDSRSMRSHVLASLKEALRARNLETSDHTRRMEKMVAAMGQKLGLSASEEDRLSLLASMHDIGKVAIPDAIINKPGRLTGEEWDVMRTHSEIGSRIAATAQEMEVIADEIACHHEHWDGGGYPYGKKGEEIPLLSRIIGVVDSYDVMTHKRVYKDAMSHDEAVEELRRCSGTQFDPAIVDLFLEIFGAMSEDEMRALGEDLSLKDTPARAAGM